MSMSSVPVFPPIASRRWKRSPCSTRMPFCSLAANACITSAPSTSGPITSRCLPISCCAMRRAGRRPPLPGMHRDRPWPRRTAVAAPARLARKDESGEDKKDEFAEVYRSGLISRDRYLVCRRARCFCCRQRLKKRAKKSIKAGKMTAEGAVFRHPPGLVDSAGEDAKDEGATAEGQNVVERALKG